MLHSKETDNVSILGDAQKIKQVLDNLLNNALKFTNEGSVEIGWQKQNNKIRIYVKDTGVGVPSEFHETIFERFRQADSVDLRTIDGSGLGLAISKAYVEAHGGEISIDPVYSNGALFYFVIPIK